MCCLQALSALYISALSWRNRKDGNRSCPPRQRKKVSEVNFLAAHTPPHFFPASGYCQRSGQRCCGRDWKVLLGSDHIVTPLYSVSPLPPNKLRERGARAVLVRRYGPGRVHRRAVPDEPTSQLGNSISRRLPKPIWLFT